ncbi:Hypothetical_protein [Hexamita inflata]|uniref:Hypothetical_protein n=1 Tax=Hexamita inflata TaxID=28002 RepID=A0AA86N520_9EUKA|nr:Hypothetical protein HINF_LOCUS654 [Hexamita inflata]
MNRKTHHLTFSKAGPVEVVHVVVAVNQVGELLLALLEFGFGSTAGIAGLHARVQLVRGRFFLEAVMTRSLGETVLASVERLFHSWALPPCFLKRILKELNIGIQRTFCQFKVKNQKYFNKFTYNVFIVQKYIQIQQEQTSENNYCVETFIIIFYILEFNKNSNLITVT